MTQTLYVAGPMSGVPDFNRPAFCEATQALRHCGYPVINPADNTIARPNDEDAWQQYMRVSVGQIARVDGIAFLSGWPASRGAAFEIFLASQIGIAVKPIADWLDDANFPPLIDNPRPCQHCDTPLNKCEVIIGYRRYFCCEQCSLSFSAHAGAL